MCTSMTSTICKAYWADELAREFDELLQPRRLSLDDPIERIAAGCGAFINQALHDPIWGALIVRAAAAIQMSRALRAGGSMRTSAGRRRVAAFTMLRRK